jgi:hypothetical protein
LCRVGGGVVHTGARAHLRREAWAKAEESPMGHLNPVPFFHLYALSLYRDAMHK